MNSGLLLEWNESKTIGIPILDMQHQGIISVINSFHFFVRNAEAESFLHSTMRIINDYTRIHFATEEDLMFRANYPGYAFHKAKHEIMVKEAYEAASRSLRAHDPEMYLHFLEAWWEDHIIQFDMDYGSCLHSFLEKETLL